MGKPLDALFKDTDKVVNKFFADIDSVSKKKLSPYIKTLIDKIEGLEKEKAALKKELNFKNLPLNEKIEQEYTNKREREEQTQEINNEVAIERGREVEK